MSEVTGKGADTARRLGLVFGHGKDANGIYSVWIQSTAEQWFVCGRGANHEQACIDLRANVMALCAWSVSRG